MIKRRGGSIAEGCGLLVEWGRFLSSGEMMTPRIIYTYTDEAPMLAAHSFLPVIEAFSRAAGVRVEMRDISLAGRILAAFPDYLRPDQRVEDALAELGRLVHEPDSNIIKLPNISASIPQIQGAVKELQEQGFAVPDFPTDPKNDDERELRRRYETVKGSAVNPVLRQGNSDRRSAPAVKAYARANPHSMGEWVSDSKTHVSSMDSGDFYGSERSLTVERGMRFRVEYAGAGGETAQLASGVSLEAGEVMDAAVMSRGDLRAFLKREMADAKDAGVLFSIHLKATMMKVSDPVIFGHAVSVYFEDLFEKHGALFAELGISADNGFGEVESRMADLPEERRRELREDIAAALAAGPDLAMVNSDRGITNLHVPSDVIIDASMPAAVRMGGKMWGPDGKERDMKAVIPDRCYAGVYAAVIDFCREHGAFDPATMGGVANVGLMAQKAEEYGSHGLTFQAPGKGVIRALGDGDEVLLERNVEAGDIFRICRVKDAPVRDWVKLAITRARATGAPAVFWLDERRAHDAQLIRKVKAYLGDYDTEGLEISIMPPAEACLFTLERVRRGVDTISVTGNVLRDYLTDLFPILELGTSAKMLSIVPLMNGGGLFETGAGGSAPKHVQQLQKENHLRWDSLGEFLALAVSFEHLGNTFGNERAKLLGKTLDEATGELLTRGTSPSRKCGELDNRGSHVYLTLYWARALAAQSDDAELAAVFAGPAAELERREGEVIDELTSVQGAPADIGGYYRPDRAKADAVMRPSRIFNGIVDGIGR